MRNSARWAARLRGLGALSLLAGCATGSQGIGDDGSVRALVFPPIAQATRSEGSFPDRAFLAQAGPGLRKSHLFQWFGPPHFREGLVGVREWDYIFHLRSGGGITTCRYKVIFDRADVARSFHWRPAACGEWLAVTAPVQAQGTAAP